MPNQRGSDLDNVLSRRDWPCYAAALNQLECEDHAGQEVAGLEAPDVRAVTAADIRAIVHESMAEALQQAGQTIPDSIEAAAAAALAALHGVTLGDGALSSWQGCGPGEAARLLGVDNAQVQADRFAAVEALAITFDCVVVLKGAGIGLDGPAMAAATRDQDASLGTIAPGGGELTLRVRNLLVNRQAYLELRRHRGWLPAGGTGRLDPDAAGRHADDGRLRTHRQSLSKPGDHHQGQQSGVC